jgi:predicted nucleic acid-binding protein
VAAGQGKPGAEAVAEACDSWLSIERVKNRANVETLIESFGLDGGEAEAIVLCQETGQRTILLDDQSAVHLAHSFGLT